MSLVQVRLARDSLETPWGFRLQGGKDLNQTLTVQRVFANTPSERELQRGDVIVAINGRDTTNLSHKQAQDVISAGGGQIEFLVQRPIGPVNIKPLSPVKDTRAPAFPQSPVRAPQINIPIHKRPGPQPQSPTRIIPISPQKPNPSHPISNRPVVSISHGQDQVDMASSGFSPKKVTLNKYGGGGWEMGSAYGGPAPKASQSHGYRPVAAPAPVHQPVAPAAPAPMSPPSRGTLEFQTQFSAPQKPMPPMHRDEGGVDSESLGGVGDTRRNFMQKSPASMPAQRSRKPPPTFGRQKPAAPTGYSSFGVDYSKPQPKPAPSKHATSARERPPPVNRRDDDETDWSGTLRSEGRQLKPWEREAKETERYQAATATQPYRPHMQPPVSPKPKVQISTPAPASPRAHAPAPVENSAPSANYNSNPQGKKQVPPGERDWNDSYVYQMIHSNEKPRGPQPYGQQQQQQQHYQQEQPTAHQPVHQQDYKFDAAIGLSDF